MSRTEPNYKLRIRTVRDETWVYRDEYDDDGAVIGVQCLKPNGFWSEQQPEASKWPTPTFRSASLRAADPADWELPTAVFGKAFTDTDGRVWTSTGDGEWSTPGGPGGTIVSSSPPKPGYGDDSILTPEGLTEAVKAIEKGRKEYGTMIVSPAMQKLIDQAGAMEEAEFLRGKSLMAGPDDRATP